ncbi:Phosphate transport system permease protein 2 [Sulfurimonas denitrificans DSM 1251]|uniref:Phosphate transport system permease protein PstA n=1 Tax=Sulfurimonas denitrificans (strain ATCC 33889 / DSM 1251) TaxID=326298 RepID=Q30PC1_SULDN|nr:phosphate ABC transporter permease PstA [Sulfurimonas denitrificans]ABB45160.1 Phosphate transport system permease protein 2 [Sulfurimonas denitrificans DSM 1251]MDD3442773.1 phosphate ABC transporter permease PstA [Sulfurimonas denitrificans]
MTYTQKRIIINKAVMTLSTLCAIIGMGFLFWILSVLVINGIDALSANIFLNEGAPPGNDQGGLKHALIGQLYLVGYASIFGVPLGILAGTYLSEYSQKSKIAEVVRDISDIMMSAPSIVIGAFVYAVVVTPMGHFSGWAGSIALTIIMLPIILRTTDDMLQLVPSTLREAAFALGAPKYKVIIQVVYRGAKAGILTGILLGVARVAGETAPLLFTSFNDNFLNTDMMQPMASLTVTMYNYASSPYEDWQQLGWAAAFILSMFILTLNILGRLFLLKKRGKH